MVTNNLALHILQNGGAISPLLVSSELSNGLGLMNPSIYNDNGKLIVNIRNVNYTLYHSEKKILPHIYGPLTYGHPENDQHLRTWNILTELDPDNLSVIKVNKIDTTKLDVEPLWEFVGLEDARVVRWDGKLYLTGVRRDTTTNGQGRMELSEIEITENSVKEISRVRIEAPKDPNSYCEKNWMPILDKPYHYIKWANPTEVVKVDPKTGKSETIKEGRHIKLPRDLRGGSQIVPFEDGYLAITHEVCLFYSEDGRKDGKYYHRFVYWDKYFDIQAYSDEFHFMGADIEFCVGMAEHNDDLLITFGFQDNAAFLLKTSKTFIKQLLYG
jgi:hypothetical protein